MVIGNRIPFYMKLLFISLSVIFFFSSSYSQDRKVIEKTFPDGSPSLVVFYNSKGERVREISYFSNGKKEYDGTFKDGKENGTFIYWYEDGQKKYEEYYKNGLAEGKQYEWDPDGQLNKTEIYKQGKLLKTIRSKEGGKEED